MLRGFEKKTASLLSPKGRGGKSHSALILHQQHLTLRILLSFPNLLLQRLEVEGCVGQRLRVLEPIWLLLNNPWKNYHLVSFLFPYLNNRSCPTSILLHHSLDIYFCYLWTIAHVPLSNLLHPFPGQKPVIHTLLSELHIFALHAKAILLVSSMIYPYGYNFCAQGC